MTDNIRQTPQLDQLETGPWPSFVKEIKLSAKAGSASANDLLGVLERSYNDKIGHWKHGGIVGVFGYGGGVIGRYNDLPEEFPQVAHFHTIRVNQPSGWFYTADILRKLCDIWDKHGSGVTNMHGSTGDIILLGCTSDALEPIFADLTKLGFDLGGSGSDMRTPSCCCGMARCEWACYDTMALTNAVTQEWQDELHRPAFPYKYKIKSAGCPNDCVASVARADMSIIGVWKDDIQVDAAKVKEYADGDDVDIQQDVCELCPTRCITWDGTTLSIDNSNCVKCMHCINVMHHALRPGKERGATILLGAKAPIIGGALLSSVMVPFLEIEEPFDDVKELVEAIWDLWGEHGNNRERVGEFIQRIGMGNFLEQIGLDPIPEMVIHPRTNPYIFFESADEDEE
ncbi:MAG: dissimilatory-type sulfite reductase subunit alpha [Deltaproteobacteria bacterium]|jgi:sulfite reductase alpha subunit|nr:dissimilatory-type sulfite reductase subunit alpha [Deltaproteobacteria bacterium]MBW2531381.1 dissimilatory-type sulfite reductase subunit alpha [Deltaproteobacteria bacterium]